MLRVPQEVVPEYTKNEKVRSLSFRTALTFFLFGITTYSIIVMTSSDVHCDGGFTFGEQLAKFLFILSTITCLLGMIYSVIIVFSRPLKLKSILYLLVLVGLCIASLFFYVSIEISEAVCFGWIYGQGAY